MANKKFVVYFDLDTDGQTDSQWRDFSNMVGEFAADIDYDPFETS